MYVKKKKSLGMRNFPEALTFSPDAWKTSTHLSIAESKCSRKEEGMWVSLA